MHQDQLLQVAGSGAHDTANNYNNFNIVKDNIGNDNGEATGNFSNIRDDNSNNK